MYSILNNISRAETVTHMKERLRYQAMILYNYAPFLNGNFSYRKEFAPSIFITHVRLLRNGRYANDEFKLLYREMKCHTFMARHEWHNTTSPE